MILWVTGGQQRMTFRELPPWARFETAVVVRIQDGVPERVLEYRSAPEHIPDTETSHLFTAATVAGERVYLCTQTEVLVCEFPTFRLLRVISHPCFNDLHHVTPGPDGHLYAAVTGLDAVAELTPEGDLVRLVDVLGGNVWDRFSPEVDYRKVSTTKPHRSHPNYVFFVGGRPWVTRFEQRDAIPLDGCRPGVTVHSEGIHDGHMQDGRVFFTGVDGHVVHVDVATCSRTDIDLNAMNPSPERPLGWCRGVLPMGHRAWVGFTRLRFTTLRRNISWIRHGFREAEYHRNLPTRIVLYDLQAPAVLDEIVLEDAGMHAVFSILTDSDS